MNTKKKLHGFIAWRGPSQLDGKPVVLIVTRAGRQSNRKTGAVVQTYILRADVSPIDAIRSGEDVSICGDCVHREKGTCYVNVAQGPTVVYKAFQRGAYPAIFTAQAREELAGDIVRLGTYGDPAAIPFHVWETILSSASDWTGYTHQWKREGFKSFARYCMASTDSREEYRQARSHGWRAFYVVPKGSIEPVEGAFLCPASEEGGKKLTCSECLACNGTSSGRQASVFIPVHGVAFKQERFNNLIQISRAS